MNDHISHHLTNTVLRLGGKGGFRIVEDHHRAMITGFASPMFNYVHLGSYNDTLITELIDRSIPFICIPQPQVEKDFQSFCEQHGLIKSHEIIAHEFTHLQDWKEQTNPHIIIKQVSTEEELVHFDLVSSMAYTHPLHLASTYARPSLSHPNLTFCVAYDGKQPIGVGLLAVEEQRGVLCWDGVLPEYRKRGVGTALTTYRMHLAKQRQVTHMVSHNLLPSVRYYQAIGFKPVVPLPLYMYLPYPYMW